MNKRKSILLGALLLLISGTALAFVLPPRISWSPSTLTPASITPGSTASFTVVLKHTGILPIPATKQLKVVTEGTIAPFITFTQPSFPRVFKRGNQVTMQVHISAPSTTNYLRKSGQLVLQRTLPNGTVKEVWRADILPTKFTFSTIALPPYPDPVDNNATLQGIDADMNDVRDDIDHYIVETYPNSAKVREALKQEARALTPFLVDADDKAQTRANNLVEDKAVDCLAHVFNNDLDSRDPAYKAILVQFLNTKERSRAYNRADGQLGGFSSNNGLASGIFERRRAACAFDVVSLPN